MYTNIFVSDTYTFFNDHSVSLILFTYFIHIYIYICNMYKWIATYCTFDIV